MKSYTHRLSPLSFQTEKVEVQSLNDWQFEVKINGEKAGYIIARNNDWSIDVKVHPFNESDKTFLIDAAKLSVEQKKTPQDASNIFHSIMKASVSKTATEKKGKREFKPKPKK